MENVFKISKYFIEKGKGAPYPVTNMKLQKLLYYAQGWFLALYDEPLFKEDFYKWDFGPVCLDVYYEYKKFGGAHIQDTYTPKSLEVEITDFLDKIWNSYGKYSAFQLSDLSHTERPWVETPSSEIISKQIIKEYYKDKLMRAND